MENAAEALKMAAAVLIFVLALSICIASFSQARVASQTLLERTDREYYATFMLGRNTERKVGLETIIPTIYKAYYENYKIVFKDSETSDGAPNNIPGGLYKQKNRNTGNWDPVYEIDLEQQTQGTRIELFLAAILYGTDYFEIHHNQYNEESISDALKTFADDSPLMELPTSGLCDKIGDRELTEYFGQYYQDDVYAAAGDEDNEDYRPSSDAANQVSGANTPEANKVMKRVITYVFN